MACFNNCFQSVKAGLNQSKLQTKSITKILYYYKNNNYEKTSRDGYGTA